MMISETVDMKDQKKRERQEARKELAQKRVTTNKEKDEKTNKELNERDLLEDLQELDTAEEQEPVQGSHKKSDIFPCVSYL